MVDLVANAKNTSLINHVAPQAFGSANIVSTIGAGAITLSSDPVPITVAGTTSIASIEILRGAFDDLNVSATDPSFALCNNTFRGFVGDEAELRGRFTYTDDDGLACPFELPLGTLTPPPPPPLAPLHDVTVLVPNGGLASSDTSSIQIGGRNLQLQQSSAGEVLITATVAAACSASGTADISGSAPIFANLEAEDYQLDVGHRCGAPVGIVQGASQQPLAVGQSTWLPVRLAVPAGNAMQTITFALTYDDAYLTINASRFGVEQGLPEFAAVNSGDTNAIRYNGVWSCQGKEVPSASDLLEFEFQVRNSSTRHMTQYTTSPVPLCVLALWGLRCVALCQTS